ncbi:MAG: peptidoglycan editing factor PgeF [Casimicrobiaceae bacterium]
MPDAALRSQLAAAGLDWIVPDWSAPASVHALSTTRHGGAAGIADFSHRNPELARVRATLRRIVPAEPLWLSQVHGPGVASADHPHARPPQADGVIASATDAVCAVLTADCLPVLFTDVDATNVAAAHAGWRGLAAGVLEATVAAMRVAPQAVIAWLGPAIGPNAFEVGDDVRNVCCAADTGAQSSFVASRPGKWHADLYALARRRLARAGVHAVYGGTRCTLTERDSFFSYRRGGDDAPRRMATVIWRSRG